MKCSACDMGLNDDETCFSCPKCGETVCSYCFTDHTCQPENIVLYHSNKSKHEVLDIFYDFKLDQQIQYLLGVEATLYHLYGYGVNHPLKEAVKKEKEHLISLKRRPTL